MCRSEQLTPKFLFLNWVYNGWKRFPEVAMFEGLFQPMHLLVIFFIALLVFGPKKLPELGKGIGEGIRALKDSMNNSDQAKNSDSKNTEAKS
jgi:sec-independent protein translocase protein TatA